MSCPRMQHNDLTHGFKPHFSSQSQGMNHSKRFFQTNKCLYQHLTYIRQYCTNTISNLITYSNYDTNNACVTYSTTSLAICTYQYSRQRSTTYKRFFFSLAYTTNYVVLTQLTLRFLKLISLLYILYNTFNIYLHWVRQWQSMRGRLHHIIDTMQILHFKNGCTLSKWPIQPELIAAFQPRSDLEYCCCPWIG